MYAFVVVEFVLDAFVATRSVSVEDAATRDATYAFVVVELVSIASVSVDDAAINRATYASVEVEVRAKRCETYALVVVAERKVDVVAVRSLATTVPVKTA
jgi:hypothetical protein